MRWNQRHQIWRFSDNEILPGTKPRDFEEHIRFGEAHIGDTSFNRINAIANNQNNGAAQLHPEKGRLRLTIALQREFYLDILSGSSGTTPPQSTPEGRRTKDEMERCDRVFRADNCNRYRGTWHVLQANSAATATTAQQSPAAAPSSATARQSKSAPGTGETGKVQWSGLKLPGRRDDKERG